MDELNLEALLPELDSLLGWVSFLVRILVMAGPLCMLGLGLYYFLAPPPEANHSAGYRFRYAMSRVGVWRFTQRLAGMVYAGTGLLLTIIMAIVCARFDSMGANGMVWCAVKCIGWELGVILAATIGVDVTVIALYDSEGNRRSEFRGFKEE